MKKLLPPEKSQFFDLLNRAVRKDEKAVSQKQKHQKSDDYNEKRTHQHKTASALRKRNDKSHQ